MAPFNWSGFYFGAHGGYAWSRSPSAYDDPQNLGFDAVPIGTVEGTGGYGGIQAGFNHQFANDVVLGIEADASFGNVSGTVPDLVGGLGETITAESKSGGTVRARLGKAFDRTLIYGTGGFSWANSTVTASDGPLSESATLYGWNLGAGVEQAITDRVSVKLEYLYTSFGDHTWFAGAPWQSTGSSTSSAVRAGINLHF